MFNIADYLKKFARIEGDSAFQKEAVKKALADVCGIHDAAFEVKKGILYVRGNPMLKSIAYTKKDALLASLKETLPQAHIHDVR